MSNLINYMDPEMVILGGILIQKCPRYFDIVADVANTRKVKEAKENKLLVSRLGENAGVIGAGEIVADEFFNETVNEVFAKKARRKSMNKIDKNNEITEMRIKVGEETLCLKTENNFLSRKW